MDFLQKLKTLGWSQARAAKEIGVFPSTVSNWIKFNEAPKYAHRYLDLVIAVREAGNRLQGLVW